MYSCFSLPAEYVPGSINVARAKLAIAKSAISPWYIGIPMLYAEYKCGHLQTKSETDEMVLENTELLAILALYIVYITG